MSQTAGCCIKRSACAIVGRLVIHMTILRPTLLYGRESLILTWKLKSNITAADMKVLRFVKEVNKMIHVRQHQQL